MRTYFLNSDEVLLARIERGGKVLLRESDFSGVAKTLHQAFMDWKGDDEACRFNRFDCTVNQVFEDVTEEIAGEWIAYYEAKIGLNPTSTGLPPYVANSDAWQRFCDGYAESLPPVLNQRTHGTLNKAMQGLSR